MTGDVIGIVGGDVTAATAVVGNAQAYAAVSMSGATRKAYQGDWSDFQGWCDGLGLQALPAAPETVGAYLAAKTKLLAVSTLMRRLAAVATAHRLAGHQLDTRHPAIRDVMRGIRRVHGVAQKKAAPATTDRVKAMADHCDASLLGVRDRAILLFGFAGAFRRSELVRVEIEHLEETADGIRIHIPRSKSDQEGQGQDIGVMRTGTAYCPVQALQLWLQAAAIQEGLVFRGVDRHGNVGASLSDKAIGLIVKRRAEDAGLDSSLFSGHSLRAGLATSAAAAGLEERDIQRQTRHQSVEQLRRYVRPATVFQNNVTKGVGL